MAEERPILEEVLDYAFYAPVGLAITVVEDLPDLVRRGRDRLETKLTIARFVGRVAAGRARKRVDKFLATPPSRPVTQLVPREVPPAPPALTAVSDVPAAGDLAIDSYESLAASQVVARLRALEPDELDAIRRYELATRGRRTILNRIAQLESDDAQGA